MRRFGRVLSFEIDKALRSRLTWVTLMLPAILTFVSVWIGEWVRRAEQIAESGDVERIASAYLGFSRGVGNGLVLGAIFLLFYSSMAIANEGNLRTFKTILLRAHTRLEWVFAKFGLLLLIGLGLLCVVVITGLASAALFGDYVAIAEEGYVFYEAGFMADESVRAVLLVIPPLIALAAFGLMVSTFTDHTGIATSACIGAYVFLEALKSSSSSARQYLFNTFMPSLLDTSYFVALTGFAEGNSDAAFEAGWVGFNLLTPLVSAALFLIVASVAFGRRDVVV